MFLREYDEAIEYLLSLSDKKSSKQNLIDLLLIKCAIKIDNKDIIENIIVYYYYYRKNQQIIKIIMFHLYIHLIVWIYQKILY